MANAPRTIRCTVLATALVLCALASGARAEPHVRNGACVGVGYGGDWAKVVLGDDQGSEWSNMVSARAGWALDQDLVLGVEYARWAKDYAIATLQGDVLYDVTLTGVLAAVTYFPGNTGFLLRGGVGAALADIDTDAPAGTDPALVAVSPDPGVAALVSAGYEARLTTSFALGVTFDVLYLGVSDDNLDYAYVYGLNLQLNWYW